jgi:hypothetical protein
MKGIIAIIIVIVIIYVFFFVQFNKDSNSGKGYTLFEYFKLLYGGFPHKG